MYQVFPFIMGSLVTARNSKHREDRLSTVDFLSFVKLLIGMGSKHSGAKVIKIFKAVSYDFSK